MRQQPKLPIDFVIFADMKIMIRQLTIAIIGCLMCTACNNDYVPKPRGYYRIDMPAKEYQPIAGRLPYSFEIPTYAAFNLRPNANPDERYWSNVDFDKFNAKIHISYKLIDNNLDQYIADAHGFVYKHTVKADAISEIPYIDSDKHVYGLLYEIKGDAASNMQFYLTDSTHNFVRGALYFNAVPNKDSLAPVLDFLSLDIKHLIETFKWN